MSRPTFDSVALNDSILIYLTHSGTTHARNRCYGNVENAVLGSLNTSNTTFYLRVLEQGPYAVSFIYSEWKCLN